MLKFDIRVPIITPHSDVGAITRALEKGAELIITEVVINSPGRAAQGWKHRLRGLDAVEVYTNNKISLWLERGTKKHKISVKGRSRIVSIGEGQWRTNSGEGSRFGRTHTEDFGERYGMDRYFTRSIGARRSGGARLRWENPPGRVHWAVEVQHPGIQARWYLRDAGQKYQFQIADMLRIAATDKITGELGIVPGAGGAGSGRYAMKKGTRFTARIR